MRFLALALLLALALAAAFLAAPALRRALAPAVAPGPRLVLSEAEEFEELFRYGRARLMPRAEPPVDVVAEGPRSLADLLPPMTRREVGFFFGAFDSQEVRYDERSYIARLGGVERHQELEEFPGGSFVMRTDALGLRRDGLVRETRPALRVLVAGDSHVDGVVPNALSFCALLEARLRERGAEETVEVLNAGVGGQTLINYLGTLERFASLRPHVFVATVYGGNDFYAQSVLERYLRRLPLHRRSLPAIEAVLVAGGELDGLLAQDLLQALHFLANPEDEELALASALEYLLAMRARCEELGARFLCLYLPPASAVQRERFADLYERASRLAGIEPSALEVSERIAERLLAGLRAAGVPALDLRPPLRASGKPCYWRADLHLSAEGHALVAAALEGPLAELAREARGPSVDARVPR